ncbi:MAG TPA: MerR family transcriptional regulator [Paenibacillus cookii]|nr:MerR family transcriptional regulator [Paenibacillus cookii]
MKISEVAKMVGLPISTIRYYEKIGIITSDYVRREQNNYRDYASDIILYLEVIKKCLAVGFSINDIKAMISKNGLSHEDQSQLILEKISEIEHAQKKLEESKKELYDILETDIICEKGFGKY